MKQRRENARRRLRRQLDRRREAARRRKQRNTIIAVVCAVVVVLGGVALGAWKIIGDGGTETPIAAPSDTASTRPPLPTRTPGPKPPRALEVTDGPCQYAESQESLASPTTFDVGVPDDPDPTPSSGTVPITFQTNQGDVKVDLDRASAPCAVQSFQFLAGQQFYDNTACHRLTEQGIFVLQCGDPTATGSGGPMYQYKDENLDKAEYPAGTLAMANSGPNTNGSQFFFVYQDSTQGLGQHYSVIGHVTEGLDVLQSIAAAGQDDSNNTGDGRPNEDVIINTVALPQ